MSEYSSNVQKLSIKEKIDVFRRVSLEAIATGASRESMHEALIDMVDDELFEAAQGIKVALETFDGQLKLELK